MNATQCRVARRQRAIVLMSAALGFAVHAQAPATPTPGRGPQPGATMLEPQNPKLPTLFLIGDSTVRNGKGDGSNGQWGWGEPLSSFFDTTKINVVNRALGGLSSRTYMTYDYWDRTLALLKPGDVLMMQFGHNDNGPLDDDSRARGTLPGVGDETREIDNPIIKKHEVVHTYGWYLKKFVTEAKAKGATPIVCSLVPRKTWKDGRIARNSEDYGKWAEDVARAEHVAFVDLNAIIAEHYDELGPERVEPLFADPHTHTSLAGAQLNAASVVAGLKRLQPNPLAAFILEQAPAVDAVLGSSPSPSVLLWPAGAPGSEGKTTEEIVRLRSDPGRVWTSVSNVHKPSLSVFLPTKEQATGAAIVIAPGGGHRLLAIQHEGYDVAQWLAQRGVAAFVLRYRLAREEGSTYQVDVHALQDAQRALRLVRSRAPEWGVDPKRVGIMGFSAGGEVAVLAGTRFDRGVAAAADPIERQNGRPDFVALIYPGLRPETLKVTAEVPPMFLLCAADDLRPTESITALFATLRTAGVPTELHVYSEGGHGFGMRARPLPVTSWPARLQEWMGSLGVLNAAGPVR
jgi:rhamnogalacturonan acetylesterase